MIEVPSASIDRTGGSTADPCWHPGCCQAAVYPRTDTRRRAPERLRSCLVHLDTPLPPLPLPELDGALILRVYLEPGELTLRDLDAGDRELALEAVRTGRLRLQAGRLHLPSLALGPPPTPTPTPTPTKKEAPMVAETWPAPGTRYHQVLQDVRANPGTRPADVIERTGLSRGTVSGCLSELRHRGLVGSDDEGCSWPDPEAKTARYPGDPPVEVDPEATSSPPDAGAPDDDADLVARVLEEQRDRVATLDAEIETEEEELARIEAELAERRTRCRRALRRLELERLVAVAGVAALGGAP